MDKNILNMNATEDSSVFKAIEGITDSSSVTDQKRKNSSHAPDTEMEEEEKEELVSESASVQSYFLDRISSIFSIRAAPQPEPAKNQKNQAQNKKMSGNATKSAKSAASSNSAQGKQNQSSSSGQNNKQDNHMSP